MLFLQSEVKLCATSWGLHDSNFIAKSIPATAAGLILCHILLYNPDDETDCILANDPKLG